MSVAVFQRRADDAPARPVVYAGRLAPEVVDREGVDVLDDVQVGQRELSAALERAPMLVVLDPLSFPFESLRHADWDCPLMVCLPSSLGPKELKAALGGVLLERLEFYDRVVTDRQESWDLLSRAYGFATSQRLEVEPGAVVDVLEDAIRRQRGDVEVETSLENTARDTLAYWDERAGALAGVAPHRAAGSLRHGLRANKAMHRVQATALSGQLALAQRAQPATRPLRVLEVGTGVGRWANLLSDGRAEFVGADVSEGMVRAAKANFPHLHFVKLDAGLALPFPVESFDVAFTVAVLHHNPPEHRVRLVAQMWQAVRPGGRLMFLEDFVAARGNPNATVHPMSIGEFTELVLDATNGGVVLEHFEALRYPHDDFHRSGLLTVSKVGVARLP